MAARQTAITTITTERQATIILEKNCNTVQKREKERERERDELWEGVEKRRNQPEESGRRRSGRHGRRTTTRS